MIYKKKDKTRQFHSDNMHEDDGPKKPLYNKFKSLEMSKLFLRLVPQVLSDTLCQTGPLQGQV
jgi:hypothetical protein